MLILICQYVNTCISVRICVYIDSMEVYKHSFIALRFNTGKCWECISAGTGRRVRRSCGNKTATRIVNSGGGMKENI